jgi:hypothetical protein
MNIIYSYKQNFIIICVLLSCAAIYEYFTILLACCYVEEIKKQYSVCRNLKYLRSYGLVYDILIFMEYWIGA